MSLNSPVLTMGQFAVGTITDINPIIEYEFTIAADGEYVISVQGADSGSGTLADPFFKFKAFNGTGYTTTNTDNNSGHGRDALTVAWAYSGWHTIDVSSFTLGKSGSYIVWYEPKAYFLMGATPGNDKNVHGTASNDSIDGLTGNDIMKGGAGNDTYYVDQTGDVVVETAAKGSDTIYSSVTHVLEANVENMHLTNADNVNGTGNKSANVITGNSGINCLNGKEGFDTLTGGDGNDIFVFDTRLTTHKAGSTVTAINVDTITDFITGSDDINLNKTIFSAYKVTGNVSADDLVYGTVPADDSDHFLYDMATGDLYYDADGSGKSAAVQFATLTGHPTLAASDLHIV